MLENLLANVLYAEFELTLFKIYLSIKRITNMVDKALVVQW